MVDSFGHPVLVTYMQLWRVSSDFVHTFICRNSTVQNRSPVCLHHVHNVVAGQVALLLRATQHQRALKINALNLLLLVVGQEAQDDVRARAVRDHEGPLVLPDEVVQPLHEHVQACGHQQRVFHLVVALPELRAGDELCFEDLLKVCQVGQTQEAVVGDDAQQGHIPLLQKLGEVICDHLHLVWQNLVEHHPPEVDPVVAAHGVVEGQLIEG
mmetsp:Transcript_5704/g.8637  ORF Transcript_5704/g.8637 Transcript_5704/m.8637 type:complete len:212 (+) Transcript_5704:207-842(+)